MCYCSIDAVERHKKNKAVAFCLKFCQGKWNKKLSRGNALKRQWRRHAYKPLRIQSSTSTLMHVMVKCLWPWVQPGPASSGGQPCGHLGSASTRGRRSGQSLRSPGIRWRSMVYSKLENPKITPLPYCRAAKEYFLNRKNGRLPFFSSLAEIFKRHLFNVNFNHFNPVYGSAICFIILR